MLDKWEQSGQGDGGRIAESDGDIPVGWGNLQGRTQETLDNQATFLADAPSWYLYFWEMVDKYPLLGSTLQRLSGSVGVPNASATLSVSRGWRQHDSITGQTIEVDASRSDSLDGSTNKINSVLQYLIEGSKQDRVQERELYINQRVNVVNDTIDNYEVQLALTGNTVFGELIRKKNTELQKLETDLEEVTLFKKQQIRIE